MKQILLWGVLLATPCLAGVTQQTATAQTATAQPAPGVLTREDAAKFLPSSVFYRGQSSPVQARNSGGLRVAGGRLVLAALVDTSGYSSGVAERYQGYLITEVPLQIGDKRLPPGCYGFGFLGGDRMVVMDVGANQVLETATARDTAIKRPTPLQIIDNAGQNRLYLGRSYVTLAPAL